MFRRYTKFPIIASSFEIFAEIKLLIYNHVQHRTQWPHAVIIMSSWLLMSHHNMARNLLSFTVLFMLYMEMFEVTSKLNTAFLQLLVTCLSDRFTLLHGTSATALMLVSSPWCFVLFLPVSVSASYCIPQCVRLIAALCQYALRGILVKRSTVDKR